MNRPAFFTSFLLALFLLASCRQGGYAVFSGYAQGGVYTVKADLTGVRTPQEQIGETIDSLLTAIDFSLSGYNKNSLLTRYNAGEAVEPDRFFTEIRALSERYRQETGGAFDVSAAPLFDIWGFGFTADSLPDPERITAALAACKEEKVLNFNAIAQGYTCDIVAGYLHSLGVHNMLVDIGEIFCEGVNPSGNGWTIGVDNPVDGNDTPGQDIRGVWTSDGSACGIVTSGNYRKSVSKVTTCGTSGRTCEMAWIPSRCAGLCSGAKSQQISIFFRTSSLTSVLPEKKSAPCTIRWPTASMSSKLESTPCSGSTRASSTSFMPTLWSGMGCVTVYGALPVGLWVRQPSGRPIFSTSPLASRS